MTKSEFEQRIGEQVPQKSYEIIENVYTFHPLIDEIKGKQQVADLYKSFGLQIFRDMTDTANTAKAMDADILAIDIRIQTLTEQRNDLRQALSDMKTNI